MTCFLFVSSENLFGSKWPEGTSVSFSSLGEKSYFKQVSFAQQNPEKAVKHAVAGQVTKDEKEGGLSDSLKTESKSTAETNGKPKGVIKRYRELITKDAFTDEGLFKVHKVADKYYYEIPDSLLRRDFLWISRYISLPAGLGGGYINAGSSVNEQLVIWERFENKILLKNKSYSAVAADSLPIYLSVVANNYNPTIYAFDIVALSENKKGVVIDVTKFLKSDVKAFSGLTAQMRRDYKVGRLDEERSFISSIKSFPENIEIKQDFTYEAAEPPSHASTGAISIMMNQSMVLLPKIPMRPRIYDHRVGWFTTKQIDYGSDALKADEATYIRRWRLEPKDMDAYKRGELVEPKKPIVYYLDPATPLKLRPYIKAGVEAWQEVFETAGFKKAIIAKDPPTLEEDPDFSPEDVRYSVIRYVASTTRNAMGPSVYDPRSGEIIESDIIWYHNHLRSYRNRYLLETGASNPNARTLNTPIEDIGKMMKEVIAHEVGHALGLPHNMRASFAYPTDSLRSKTFTQKYGIAASIMDYARYNYVAQPGDENVAFVRQIGPYDHFAINWGYRVIPAASRIYDERPTLSKWIEEKADDPVYQFGSGLGNYDPASQTEGIGDDLIKASSYGLSNLKVVALNLITWTAGETNDYDDLEELYNEMVSVWSRYISHVLANIGGVYEKRLNPNQHGFMYSPVDAGVQKASLDWILENAFSSPEWLHQAAITRNIHHANHLESMRSLQVRHLESILSFDRLARLMENEVKGVEYNALDMVRQLQNGMWSEIRKGNTIDIYRRNLQKAYIERMAYLLNDKSARQSASRAGRYGTKVEVDQSDIRSIIRGELVQLEKQLRKSRKRFKDDLSRYHIEDILVRIDSILHADK